MEFSECVQALETFESSSGLQVDLGRLAESGATTQKAAFNYATCVATTCSLTIPEIILATTFISSLFGLLVLLFAL